MKNAVNKPIDPENDMRQAPGVVGYQIRPDFEDKPPELGNAHQSRISAHLSTQIDTFTDNSPQNIKVLHLTLSFETGGRREAMATLARRLRNFGVRCELACLEALGCQESELAGIYDRWTVLTPPGGGRSAAVSSLRRLCQEREIDVIHCHGAASQFLAIRAFWWRRSPRIVMTFHRSLNQDTARFRDRVRNSLAGLRCSAVVVGSRERWRHYTTANYIAKRKVIRIPFGIDTNRFRADAAARDEVRRELGIKPEHLLVGMAGHFGPEKGIDVGLRAFAECVKRGSGEELRMIVLGKGQPDRLAALQALSDKAGSHVQFVGFRPDRERYFAAMDVFLHTPRLEAFGLVVAEAMATGLPIVATKVGGMIDLVRAEETGFLAPSEDVAAIASAIERLAGDGSLRSQLGENASEVAEADYSAEIYASRYTELYRAVLAGSPIDSAPFQPIQSMEHAI